MSRFFRLDVVVAARRSIFNLKNILKLKANKRKSLHSQKATSYKLAFLSPEPVTINFSSHEMSQLSTEDVSFDYEIKFRH